MNLAKKKTKKSKLFFAEDPVQKTVEDLADWVLDGKVALADFQRSAVWKKKKNKQLSLFKSLLIGIPTGVLYLWAYDKDKKHPNRRFEGLEEFYSESKIKYLVLDGQQRLTTLASLYASARYDDSKFMGKVVFDLKKNQKTEQPFSFVKDEYELKSHELFLQEIIGGAGMADHSAIMAKSHPELTTYVAQVYEAFTTRQIAIQYIQSHADKADALNIFGTVNQEGVALSDIDHIQAILTSTWPDFHDNVYNLEKNLHKIPVSVEKDGEIVLSPKLTSIKRDILIKAVLWQLYGTTQRKAKQVKANLTVYDTKSLDGKLLKSKDVKAVFDVIEKGALAFKKMLLDELYIENTTNHSQQSILGGILFHANNPQPDDSDRGKLLAWYILSSYYLHWSGGSTDDLVDETCKAMTDESGVQWDDLWEAFRQYPNSDHKERNAKIGDSGNFSDLLPKIGKNQFPGTRSKTGKIPEGMWNLLIRRTLPCQRKMQDWFTGERLDSLPLNKYSIHHIFPQSKFTTNKFTQLLIENEITYASIIEASKKDNGWTLVKKRLLKILQESEKFVQADLKKLVDEQEKFKEEKEVLVLKIKENKESFDPNEVLEKNLAGQRKKLNKKIKDGESERAFQETHQTNIINALKSASSSEDCNVDVFEKCWEFWYRHENCINNAIHHPANLVSIKTNTNSAVGNQWPSYYLKRYQHHEKRIEKQFISLKDFSHFDSRNYDDFVNRRLEHLLKGVNDFLQSLYDGKWASSSHVMESQSLTDMIAEEGDDIELKESAIFDTKKGQPVWDDHPKHPYLISAIVRAVVSFANGGGGTVIVGVDDKGKIVGLKRDLSAVEEKDPESNAKEELKRMVQQRIINCKPKNWELGHVKIRWSKELEDCLVIEVKGSSKPVKQDKYFKTKKLEDGTIEVSVEKDVFWARSGASTVRWDPVSDEEE